MPSISLDCKSASAPYTKNSRAPPNSISHTPPPASPLDVVVRPAVTVSSTNLPIATNSQSHTALTSGSQHHQQAAAMSIGFLPTPLEQYRLQLYNYAVHVERLRCPEYAAAAAAAAAANAGTQQQLLPTAATAAAVAAFSYSNVAAAAAAATVESVGSGNAHSSFAHGSRIALSMSLFPQRIFQPEEPKPQHSYIGLIAMAILSSVDTKLVLSDIYQYILDNYPYFRTRGPGWRNSIRHNLSLNDCFVKSGRSANGKGHYWAIHPANMEDFRKGDFRRRKAQRKVRKHMGLSVDDEGTDSPSPPPLSVTPPVLHLHPPALHHLHSHHLTVNPLHHLGYLQQHHHHHHHQTPQQFNAQQHYGPASVVAAVTTTQLPPNTAHCIIEATDKQPSAQHPIPQVSQNPQSQQQLSIIKKTTRSVIANLYSQKRKRQFDVASLLAPDIIDDEVVHDSEMTTTTTKRTLIRKLSVQQHHHYYHHHHHAASHHHHQTVSPQALTALTYQRQHTTSPKQQQQQLLYELDDQEDIDVVASDVDDEIDTEAEGIDDVDEVENKENYIMDEDDGDVGEEEADEDEENKNKRKNGVSSVIDVSGTAQDFQTTQTALLDDSFGGIEEQQKYQHHHQEEHSSMGGSRTCANDGNESRGASPRVISEGESASNTEVVYKSNPLVKQQQYQRIHHGQHQQHNIQRLMHNLPNELSNMDPRIFGRYYGTYMAAAAQQVVARRITSTINFPQLEANSSGAITPMAPMTAAAISPASSLDQQQLQLQHHQQQLPQN